MKKLVVILLICFVAIGVFGQNVVRSEVFIASEIGAEEYIKLIEVLIEDATMNYKYAYYYIDAPYKNAEGENYKEWQIYAATDYLSNGLVLFSFTRDQSVEYLLVSNDFSMKYRGQDFVYIKSEAGINTFNRLIRSEQTKALARLPRKIKDRYASGYWFYIDELDFNDDNATVEELRQKLLNLYNEVLGG
jgi:hypothetical protein